MLSSSVLGSRSWLELSQRDLTRSTRSCTQLASAYSSFCSSLRKFLAFGLAWWEKSAAAAFTEIRILPASPTTCSAIFQATSKLKNTKTQRFSKVESRKWCLRSPNKTNSRRLESTTRPESYSRSSWWSCSWLKHSRNRKSKLPKKRWAVVKQRIWWDC